MLKNNDLKWWEGHDNEPSIADGHVSSHWAAAGLIMHAVKAGGGRVCYTGKREGILAGSVNDFVDRIRALGGHVVKHDPSQGAGDDGDSFVVVFPSGACSFYVEEEIHGGESTLTFATDDRDLYDKLVALGKECIQTKTQGGRVYVLIATDQGIKLKSMGVAANALEVGNYNPRVVKDFEHVIEDLERKDPCGRIVILDGKPGTGKTYLVKAMIEAVDALFVIVPSHMIADLTNPSMVNALLEVKRSKGDAPVVFLIEDADHCLVPRGQDNMPSLSGLLNFGDGILGALIDLRIVCTTNAKGNEMDPAIMRPGRLCRRIEVGPLEAGVAQEAYKRLTGKDREFTKSTTIAEVYKMAREDGWEPPKDKSFGFGS